MSWQCLLLLLLTATNLDWSARHAAAQSTWSGGGTNNNWSTPQNWSPAGAPSNDGTAELALTGSTRLSPHVDLPWSIASLTFPTGANSFTVGGSALTLGAGGIVNQSQSAQTLNTPVVLAADQTWYTSNGKSGYLLLESPLNTNGYSLRVTGVGGGYFNGGVSGAGSLTFALADNLTYALFSSNTHSGGTVLESGRLFIDSDSNLGAPESPLTFNGGQLGTGNAFTINREVFLGAAGGTIDNSVAQGRFTTIASKVHGPGALTLYRGRFKLTGTNSYIGGTLVDESYLAGTTNSLQGDISLDGVVNTVLEFNQSFDGTYSGSISGTGGEVAFNGTGTIALTGNNSYTAVTSLNAGVLEVSTTGPGLSPSSPLGFGNDGNPSTSEPILQFVGGGTFTRSLSQVGWDAPGGFGARDGDVVVNLGGNSDLVSLDPFSNSIAKTLVFGSPTSNSTIDFENPIFLGPAANTSPAPHVKVVAGAGGDQAVLSGVISGGNSLTKSGNGRLVLAAANVYTGPTYIGGGILSIDSLADGGMVSGIGQSSSASANLRISGGGILQYTGPTVAIDRGLTLSSQTGGIQIQQVGTNLTLSGAIVGPGAIEKSGPGTLTLIGTNTYSGTTTAAAGSLRLRGNGSFAKSPAVMVSSGSTLDVAGVSGGANFSSAKGVFQLAAGQTLIGSGTVLGTVLVGPAAMIRGGNPPSGPLTVNGSLQFAGGDLGERAALGIDLDGASATGALVSQVELRGAENAWEFDVSEGAVSLRLINDEHLRMDQSYSFVIATSAGGFARNGVPVTSYAFRTDFSLASENFPGFKDATLVVVGSDTLVLTLTPIPEPSALSTIGLTVLAFAGMFRTRLAARTHCKGA